MYRGKGVEPHSVQGACWTTLIWPEKGSRTGSVCAAADFWIVLDTFNKCLLYPSERLEVSSLSALLNLTKV